MADPERAAGDRAHGGSVGAAVVGDQSLGGDAVVGEVLNGAAQKGDGGGRFLVGENFDVGQAGGVVDGDVHVLPAAAAAADTFGVGAAARGPALPGMAGEAVSGAVVDAAELLDVDVDQLPGSSSLVALGGLQAQPTQPTQPDPGQDPRHGRERHIEALGDLGAGQTQPAQRRDDLDSVLLGAVGDNRRG